MVKRIIPGNMSPWECEINDVKYVYPPGTEQMVPDEVAHVIDAWYASQEPKYPEPVQPEGGGGSGGGAQPDWNAAEGEPGHILNRTHYFKIVEEGSTVFNNLVAADEGMYLYLGQPAVFVPGREYSIRYAGTTYKCIGVDPAVLGEPIDGGCAFGNVGALTGGEDTGEPFVILSYGRNVADMFGASAMIADMSGSFHGNVYIDGPRRERERIGIEWLSIPNVVSLLFDVITDSNGNGTVTCDKTAYEIYLLISSGCVVYAIARVYAPGGELSYTLGLDLFQANDISIVFERFHAEGSGIRAVYEINVPLDGSVMTYSMTVF